MRAAAASFNELIRRFDLQDEDDVAVLINLGLLLQHQSQDFVGAEECFERFLSARMRVRALDVCVCVCMC